ncbi:ATP-binding cassette domain-containing protein [Butyrivibrio sp. AE3004]|uniref:ATP-binding cassette domain-containing protein n=1 Tax=Butyrivibrio sp. AE3004 TaxID=1506994 RepID=UPI0004944830|nr:ATP-binding cassette domain-containing protein [Butyrivibrio sp. AE3004]
MGWFEDQIKERNKRDQEAFEYSMEKLVRAVIGQRGSIADDDRLYTSEVIRNILTFFGCKNTDIPSNIDNLEEELEYSLQPNGIMRRKVELTKGWSFDGTGLMLGFFEEDKSAVLLIPRNTSGYYYRDRVTGRKIKVKKHDEKLFSKEAYVFYKPLPLRKLDMSDLISFMTHCITPGDVVSATFASFMVVFLGMLIPLFVRILTGPVLDSGNMRFLLSTALVIGTTVITTQLINTIKSLLLFRVETKMSAQVEAAVMMRIMSLPASFFREFSSGELAKREQSIEQVCSLLISNVFSTILAAIMSLFYIYQVFIITPVLFMPAITIVLLVFVIVLFASLLQTHVNKKLMKASAEGMGITYGLISGIQKIKLAGAEKRAFAKWTEQFAQKAQCLYNPPFFLKINNCLVTAVLLFGNVVLYDLAARNHVSQSDFYAFNVAFGQVMAAFVALANIASSIAQIRPAMEMAGPILNAEPEVYSENEVIERLSGSIELNNVSFRYDNSMPYIINNLSLKIKAGEYVAIVGETGCGKSTLVRLLLGFEKPEKGAIYYDKKAINSIDLKSLRKKIGVVLQNSSLIQGDIFSNITISAPSLTLEEAWEAAEIAGMGDAIRNMPMGMHTIISEGHGGISGGQKQRIMIARAIAPKPKILIFDEATSALDNITQKKVSDALDGLNCTRIVIAHRLSTIKNCDRILLLKDGKIAEEGSFEELVEKKGYFAELVKRQLA